MFGIRLHEAPHHICDIGKNEPKSWSSQLLVVLGFTYVDVCVDFVSSNQPLARRRRGGGGVVESVANGSISDYVRSRPKVHLILFSACGTSISSKTTRMSVHGVQRLPLLTRIQQ